MTNHGTFSHPFTPYPIQLDFMNALYETLDSYKVGIFESPTGTGKTLSLICASMTWLRDHKKRELDKALQEVDEDEEEEDWIKEEAKEIKRREYCDRIREFEEKLKEIRKIEEQEQSLARDEGMRGQSNIKRPRTDSSTAKPSNDDEFLVDEYESDTEKRCDLGKSAGSFSKHGYSEEVQVLLDQINKESEAAMEDDELTTTQTKIFFASRTHSQLSQFAGQLKMAKFASFYDNNTAEEVKQIALSSRQQLCIHKKVSQYRDVTQKNDACLDMQKKENTRCEFMLNVNKLQDKVRATDFRNRALAQIRDIEDLAQLGKDMGVCPYYEARRAVPRSEVVALPYQLLIQPSARKALGIDVKDSVVIIDEAHNIMDTISSLFSLSVSLYEVHRAEQGLQIYRDKFQKRLKGGNRIYLAQTLKVVASLRKFLETASQKPSKETSPGVEVSQTSILQDTGSLVNVYKLENYLQQSKLAFKIESYLESIENENEKEPMPKLVLTKVIAFLLAICNPSSEGKVFFGRTPSGKLQLQYLLLDPSAHFKTIVEEARCVVLAGGTMEPVGDYLNYLFPYLDKSSIRLFNCGHVIPQENMAVSTLSTSAAKKEFSFTFANRSSKDLADQLCKTLVNLAAVIPAGMVVFFPSYQYLNELVGVWKSTGVLDRLQSRKKLFMEPRDGSVDTTLSEYKGAIVANGGAILFSVVGGKMSEGINFSDDLARGIVMVGLPFPNLMSAEMVAKRDYIESKVISSGGSKQKASQATKDFYENICMRAVNQSIGRAIRHANDYAAIVLIDSRYATERIQGKLPQWIRERLDVNSGNSFPECISTLGRFFRSKRQ